MIVFGTLGSHGDLHPYLAMAVELKRRGYAVKVASVPYHRASVERAGVEFCPVRPVITPSDRQILESAMDVRRGSEFILRKLIFPALRDTYADFEVATRGADLIVTQVLMFAGMILAEKKQIPWVSSVLAPFSFISPYDPPVVAGFETFNCLHALGPRFMSGFIGLIRRQSERWQRPVDDFRRELGLEKGRHVLFEGQHSELLSLALFSKVMGAPQSDWPGSVLQAGFPHFDEPETRLAPELEAFLAAGEPPVVFTLGTAAVHTAGDFYLESFEAVRRLGRRAVFLVGADYVGSHGGLRTPRTCVAGYAPYEKLFARSRAVVHQGGIGTTAQVLRSGKPMLVVPFGHDQFDNAARAARLGVARTVSSVDYDWRRAYSELGELLENRSYEVRAAEVGATVRSENGLQTACDALARLLK